jgi:hypothetical protein
MASEAKITLTGTVDSSLTNSINQLQAQIEELQTKANLLFTGTGGAGSDRASGSSGGGPASGTIGKSAMTAYPSMSQIGNLSDAEVQSMIAPIRSRGSGLQPDGQEVRSSTVSNMPKTIDSPSALPSLSPRMPQPYVPALQNEATKAYWNYAQQVPEGAAMMPYSGNNGFLRTLRASVESGSDIMSTPSGDTSIQGLGFIVGQHPNTINLAQNAQRQEALQQEIERKKYLAYYEDSAKRMILGQEPLDEKEFGQKYDALLAMPPDQRRVDANIEKFQASEDKKREAAEAREEKRAAAAAAKLERQQELDEARMEKASAAAEAKIAAAAEAETKKRNDMYMRSLDIPSSAQAYRDMNKANQVLNKINNELGIESELPSYGGPPIRTIRSMVGLPQNKESWRNVPNINADDMSFLNGLDSDISNNEIMIKLLERGHVHFDENGELQGVPEIIKAAETNAGLPKPIAQPIAQSAGISSNSSGASLWTSQQSYLGRFARGQLLTAGVSGAEFFASQMHERSTGRSDVGGEWEAGGALVGGLVGGGLGAFFGGFGAAMGANAGTNMGSAAGAWIAAPYIRSLQSDQLSLMAAGTLNILSGEHKALLGSQSQPLSANDIKWMKAVGPAMGIPTIAGASEIETLAGKTHEITNWAKQLSSSFNASSSETKNIYATQEDIISAFSSVVQGLISGGINPSIKPLGLDNKPYVSGGENMAGAITHVLAARYGKDAPQVASMVASVLGSLPETGGNMTDILMSHGAQSAYLYAASRSASGTYSTSMMDLSSDSATIRGDERAVGLASLKLRGSGAAMEKALHSELDAIAKTPMGTSSMLYAQTAHSYHDASMMRMHQTDIVNYDIPMTHIEGLKARSEYLPYSPGYTYKVAMEAAGMRSKQLNILVARRNSMKKAGMLSEEEELTIDTQIENLQTQNAQDIGAISTGGENRMAALSVGVPASFGRFDSFSLAALNLGLIGHPGRQYGAVTGYQSRMQDQWVEQYLGNTPHNTPSQFLNSPLTSLNMNAAALRKMVYYGGNLPVSTKSRSWHLPNHPADASTVFDQIGESTQTSEAKYSLNADGMMNVSAPGISISMMGGHYPNAPSLMQSVKGFDRNGPYNGGAGTGQFHTTYMPNPSQGWIKSSGPAPAALTKAAVIQSMSEGGGADNSVSIPILKEIASTLKDISSKLGTGSTTAIPHFRQPENSGTIKPYNPFASGLKLVPAQHKGGLPQVGAGAPHN